MTAAKILTKQTQEAYNWTNKLLDSVPFEKWDALPEQVNSSISWQAGHLIMSHYYHTVMVLKGHDKEVFAKFSLKDYNTLYTKGDPRLAKGKTDPFMLRENLTFMQEKSMQTILSLTLAELNTPLEATEIPHPLAKTKFEAIDWNIKHTMWHCGQLGILKRLANERYFFQI